ncbi:uncharacterized protein LOC127565388 [Drosophila albomicans]|uniref:Uncharacterized protein LOC127565388 n=1 Tax=Drosophila albomicans TaxID=7291 RepID=A0A9C6T3M0_DROAB|nr:uncharacterized protein LOC127565388 [Drosophila albomicans]
MGVDFVVFRLVLGIFAVLIPNHVEAAQFKWTNIFCAGHNESWVHMNECRLRAISRNLTTLNLNASIFHPVNDITLDVQLFKKANGYKPWIFKSVVDMCRFLKTKYNPYAKIAFTLVKDFSNLNHSCPYWGLAIVKDFYVNPVKVGLPFPTGDYLLGMKWLYDKKLQMTTNFYFSYTENVIDM